MTQQDAFNSIKAGATKDEVVALLGEPSTKENNTWYYDFLNGGPIPEIMPGTQLILGGEIRFDNKGVVISTAPAWIDKM